MELNVKEYKDKVRGCWLGKNIGGNLGAPYECIRGVFDLNFYTNDLSKGTLPNDDLDLQLVWLNAAEKYGRNVDAEILGEYWLSYIVANWSEYGAGKNNLSMGLIPPLSGWYNNHNRDSCGAFIRSEIWACLAPGHPKIAVKYAFEDAITDHSYEGVYAEIFCAALESAAFTEKDRDKLIEIGLSYIPQNCDIRLAVNTVRECYKNGLSWKAARKKVLQTVPGSFGMYKGYQDREAEEDIPVGNLGYDAPSNIGLMIIGFLYGEGDFSNSICIAAGCGEDGDCTAATLGAIIGIIEGAKALPENWLEPIGDEIKTISIDLTNRINIPQNITDLSSRVSELMPAFMGEHCKIMCDDGVKIFLNEGEDLFDKPIQKGVFETVTFKDILEKHPFGITKKNVLFNVTVNYIDGITIKEGVEKKLKLNIENNIYKQQWIKVTWHIPSEWNVSPCVETFINLNQAHGGSAINQAEYAITPRSLNKGKYDIILEIISNGRLSKMYIPITFILG